MSLDSSNSDVEKRAVEAYERWQLGTQLVALVAPLIATYPTFHYCSDDAEVLIAGIGITVYTLFGFVVLPDIMGKAMSDRVLQRKKLTKHLS